MPLLFLMNYIKTTLHRNSAINIYLKKIEGMYYEKIADQRYAMIDKVLKRQNTLK
jgi:hypothetical protein